jgi:Effector-associated domain 11
MGRLDNIKRLIAAGKLDEAIYFFLKFAEQQADTVDYNSAVTLSMSYEDYRRDKNRGVLSYSEATNEASKIATRLLDMVDDLDRRDAIANEFADY